MTALLTVDDVAALLQVRPKWVERRAVAGEIESVKVGHYRRFRPEAVELFIAKNSTADTLQRTVRSSRRRAS